MKDWGTILIGIGLLLVLGLVWFGQLNCPDCPEYDDLHTRLTVLELHKEWIGQINWHFAETVAESAWRSKEDNPQPKQAYLRVYKTDISSKYFLFDYDWTIRTEDLILETPSLDSLKAYLNESDREQWRHTGNLRVLYGREIPLEYLVKESPLDLLKKE